MDFRIVFVYFAVIINHVVGYKILALFLHSGKSHFDSFQPLVLRLAEDGHEVTVVSHFPSEKPIKNYRDVSLKGSLPIWHTVFSIEMFDIPWYQDMFYHVVLLNKMLEFGNDACKAFVENAEIHKFKEKQFDIALVEMFNTDCGMPLLYKLKIPYIGIASHVMKSWTGEQFGLLDNPAFVPTQHIGFPLNPPIFQRFQRFLVTQYYKFMYRMQSYPFVHEIWSKHIENLPPIDELAKNTSLLLLYTHHTLHRNRLFPPNIIEIGGYYLPEKSTNLKPDMKEFLDNAKEGVIIFSMGSMLKGISWPKPKLESFKSALSEFPQTILWKWENDTMENKPENVRLLKWMQQYEIINHRNVKGFITHGGNLGMSEAMFAGKPIVVIPLYGDQHNNAASAEYSGIGVILDYRNISYDSVKWAVKKILSQRMQDSAKMASERWKDRPLDPMKTALFWIEHVIKFGGDHLKSPALNIPLYEYLSLDLLAIFSIILLTYLLVICKCMKCVKRVKTKEVKRKKN